MMTRQRRRTFPFLASLMVFLVFAPPGARSQGWGAGSSALDGFAAGTRRFGEGWLPPAGSSSFLPLGGWGGFVPYAPGPGQGVGVMPRTGGPATGMGVRLPGEMTGLGRPAGAITPLAPISIMGRPGMGQGVMSGGLIRPLRATGAMPRMRPPVGSYPFRVPPSLLGPAAAGPAMSM